MDFYRAQDQARRLTGRLVLLFGAAVLTLVILTNVLVGAALVFVQQPTSVGMVTLVDRLATIDATTWLIVTLGVVGTITLACLFKVAQLNGGGPALAESLGGRRVAADSTDPAERRLLNVVEEMALAAGTSVPPVYLLPEPGINAFAAGFGSGDAVIGVNQGTIDALTRDELQGVVAHEFSHLLNGDTRINLRLIALLHGILFIGLVGRLLLRGSGSGHRSGRRSGSNGAPVALFGVGLMIIGFGGTFFGNLIKSAVSRQREYLADGAAVQFTRNPDGIANALKKIGGATAGSLMTRAGAAEASHMYFANGISHWLGGLMATHPPLDDRIRAIQPRWDGNYIATTAGGFAVGSATAATAAATTSRFADGPIDRSTTIDVLETEVADSAALVGNPSQKSQDMAEAVLESTTRKLRDAAHQAFDARALLYAMLLSDDAELREEQIRTIARLDSDRTAQAALRLLPDLDGIDDLHRLTLAQTAMPALKEGSKAQARSLLRTLTELIKADRQIALFEWVLHRLMVQELRPHFEKPEPPKWEYGTLSQVADACSELLTALATRGNPQARSQEAAFRAGADALGLELRFEPQPDPNLTRLSAAMTTLRKLTPLAKPRVLKAAAETVLADELVTVDEGALLQGVSAALDCPLPPAIYAELKR
ncbi:MAG: M48 family metallopeptidase [Pseudomonadota bacterium]